MNNSNFGYDCRNNADNYSFTALFDEIEDLAYAKEYQNVFDSDISEFLSSEFLKRQM